LSQAGQLDGILFAASFMQVFEHFARGLFRFFRGKLSRAGPAGKLFYLPFFLGSCLFCAFLVIVSLGTAFSGARP